MIDLIYPHDEWTQDEKLQNPFSGIYSINVSCQTHSEPISSIKSFCVVEGNFLEPKTVTVDCHECGIRAEGKKQMEVCTYPEVLIMHKCDFKRNVDWGKYEYVLKAFATKDRKAYAMRGAMWREFSPKVK
jgi:ubiquitin C-terminal hydrolase